MQKNEAVPRSVLYIATSQYSGSTLVSFLLNTHSRVTTAGHTIGWHFAEDEDFFCSCGRLLQQCPFYRSIASAYERAGIPFDFREFGTEYRLAGNDRLNRYLTASLPIIQSSALELARDGLLSMLPPAAARLQRHERSNITFIQTAMEYSGAEVYVDNSHDPYRFRHLSRISDLRTLGLHLIRDPRGVVLSCMKHANWSVELSIRMWIRRQSDIVRIFSEARKDTMTLCYEDLCQRTDETLSKVYRFAGLDPETFSGNFDDTDHHILGNEMRLRGGKIQLDEKWRRDLDSNSIVVVNEALATYGEAIAGTPLSAIIQRYLDAT